MPFGVKKPSKEIDLKIRDAATGFLTPVAGLPSRAEVIASFGIEDLTTERTCTAKSERERKVILRRIVNRCAYNVTSDRWDALTTIGPDCDACRSGRLPRESCSTSMPTSQLRSKHWNLPGSGRLGVTRAIPEQVPLQSDRMSWRRNDTSAFWETRHRRFEDACRGQISYTRTEEVFPCGAT